MTTCAANQLEAKKVHDLIDTSIVQNLVKITDKGLYGLSDIFGHIVCACKYDEIKELQEGYFGVRINSVWGVVGSDGMEVFPCKASTIYFVEKGRVYCSMDDDVYAIKLA